MVDPPTTKGPLDVNNRAHPIFGNVNVIYELRAVTKGVQFAINNADVLFCEERVAFAYKRKLRILLDNLYLTQVLKGELSIPDDWYYEEFMKLIGYLRKLDWYAPEHIYREKNWLADAVAFCARESKTLGMDWVAIRENVAPITTYDYKTIREKVAHITIDPYNY